MEEYLHRQTDVDAELSMRRTIHALNQKVKQLTCNLDITRQKKETYYKDLVSKRRELRRCQAHSEWLQKRYDMLIKLIKENGLTPPIDNEADKE